MKKFGGFLCAAAIVGIVYFSKWDIRFPFGFSSSYTYKHANEYVAGDREITDKIDKIEIDYVAGDVKLITADTDKVTIEETSKKKMKENQQVHTWVEGSTLHVRYCKSDRHINLSNLDKKLEITIPEDVKLDDLTIEMASGNVDATCEAEKFNLDAASGEIVLNQIGEADEVKVDTASGDINLNLETVDKLKVSAASGDIKVNGEDVKDVDSDTASGKNEYHLAKEPENTSIHSASGDVKIYLPENADIKADFDTASGEISFKIEHEKDGSEYISGKGSNKLKVDTASGDIAVLAE